MNIISILKNNLYRILVQKAVLIVAVLVIPIMIAVAVLFSVKTEFKGHFAFITDKTYNIPQNDKIQIDVMHNRPAYSELLLGKYIAIVEEKKDGAYKVTTIKNKADKKIIETFFKSGEIIESKKGKRGTGTTILGFIVIIILMQGVALSLLFPEDRTLKTFRRVLTAPVSEKLYLFSQEVFTFIGIYIPTFMAITITKVCFGVNIGFSLGMLAILIGILSALSTSLALFFSSVLERNVSLVATVIYVITSVLAGCFYSFTGSNKVLDALCNTLPQKVYMTMAQGIETGKSILEFKGQLIYLLIWITALLVLGSNITKRKIEQGLY
ncbi:MAG: ABC transporter permease [Bacillota bacterium]|nr:ABC transporter permease [Bacillota bacterium]